MASGLALARKAKLVMVQTYARPVFAKTTMQSAELSQPRSPRKESMVLQSHVHSLCAGMKESSQRVSDRRRLTR